MFSSKSFDTYKGIDSVSCVYDCFHRIYYEPLKGFSEYVMFLQVVCGSPPRYSNHAFIK
jgi:hypothetical protein